MLTPAGLGAAPAAKCASPNHPGGDWPSYGHDLSNSRSQDREETIDASNAAGLVPAWTFSATDEGGNGAFQSTPVIAEGCVYVTTGAGHIYALNADSGAVVWKGRYAKTVAGVCCGSTLFAPTVQDGVLYANVSRNPTSSARGEGPFAIAIDAHTGKVIWKSDSIANQPGSYTNSSAVYYDGMLFFGISGPENGETNTGGFAILDAETGELIKRTRTVPPEDAKLGYGGGSIWATAVVDPRTKHAYVGTGQPTQAYREHQFINSIIKVDLDRDSDTFGEIVDAYKATPDSRLHGQAPCQEGPPEAAYGTCVYTDVDFGASPTLLKDSRGNTLVVEYQKDGTLHAVFADTMQKAWHATLAPFGHAPGNYASTATNGTEVFGAGTYPGQVFSVDADWGGYNWAQPSPTIYGANPMTHANGVVYHVDGQGGLHMWDAASGAPAGYRQMQADVGGECLNAGGGVAVARNTVYSVCGERGPTFFGPSEVATGWLVAYRLPEA